MCRCCGLPWGIADGQNKGVLCGESKNYADKENNDNWSKALLGKIECSKGEDEGYHHWGSGGQGKRRSPVLEVSLKYIFKKIFCSFT